MNVFARMSVCLVVFVLLCGSLLTAQAVRAAPPPVSLLYGEWRPQELIGVADARVSTVGAVWRGAVDTSIFTATSTATPVTALVGLDSRFTVACREPSTTIGVQFLGARNDGWARIRVDGTDTVWDVATQGGAMVDDAYIEIAGLPPRQQVFHIETLLAPGAAAVGHVTVAAFGCGPLTAVGEPGVAQRSFATDGPSTLLQTVYLPTIRS